MHAGEFADNAGNAHQRTDLTATQRDILRAMHVAEPTPVPPARRG